jgi:hypothetical protein
MVIRGDSAITDDPPLMLRATGGQDESARRRSTTNPSAKSQTAENCTTQQTGINPWADCD